MKLLPIIPFVSLALAVNITFVKQPDCVGDLLYGRAEIEEVSCYDISDLPAARSVYLDHFDQFNDQEVSFFEDDACRTQIATVNAEICYREGLARVAAFSVSTRTTNHLTADLSAVATKELVPYGIKLSNYTGLAVPSPGAVDLPRSLPFITRGASLILGGIGLSISANIVSCVTGWGTPVGITSCVIAFASSVITFVGHRLLAHAGQGVQESLRANTGQFVQGIDGGRRRETIEEFNHDYLAALLEHPEWQGRHVGYMMRNTSDGEHQGSVFEFAGFEGNKMHMSAHYDEGAGGMVHHLFDPSQIPNLHARQHPSQPQNFGFDKTRFDGGGIDFTVCPHNGGASTVAFSGARDDLYHTFYEDLSCLLTPQQEKNAHGLHVDLYNGNSRVMAGINMASYKNNGPSQLTHVNRCNGKIGRVDQACEN